MGKKVKLFRPHKGQETIINEFVIGNEEVKWGIVSCGRQFGKTLLAMNTLLYWALTKPGSKIVFITPYQNQGEAVYSEIAHASAEFVASKNSMTRKITFKPVNGKISEILFRSSENAEALRGYTFDYGVLDEAAFMKPEVWQAFIRPIFAVKGKKVMVISTPWIKNDFYEYFKIGEDPDQPQYKSFHAISTDNPYFPEEELEAAKLTMSEEVIRQEYYAEFADSAGGVFQNIYDACKVAKYKKSNHDDVCFIGVDIALGGDDWTCVVIMDEYAKVINVERWQESNTELQIIKLKDIISKYNIGRGQIEINQERGIAQSIKRDHKNIREWTTTRKNKPGLIQNLKKDLEDGVVKLPSPKLNPIMYREFGDFTFEAKAGGYIAYTHPPGGHDDTIIATALANEARSPGRYGKKLIMI